MPVCSIALVYRVFILNTMSRILSIAICIILLIVASFSSQAQSGNANTLQMLAKGPHRFLLIFSPDGQHQALLEQSKMLRQAHAGVTERDMVVVQVVENNVEAMPAVPERLPEATALRQAYHIEPDKFTLILVGKDGGEKYRATHAQAPAVLFSIIDAMPMRQSEVKDKNIN